MIIFMDEIICKATGGDIEDAYAAPWELPLIWSIISCEIRSRNKIMSKVLKFTFGLGTGQKKIIDQLAK